MRAYVTGGTGFVGSNIVKVFAEGHRDEVHCPVRRHVPDGDVPYAFEPLDLLDSDQVRASVGAFDPDVIVHSMILNDMDTMYADRELAWASYVGTTAVLADAADEVGATLVLVSTDWVFDGTQAGAHEETPPNPVNYYGVLKVASEQVALNRAERGCVARVSGVNGMHWARPSAPRAQDRGFGYFVASLVDALSAGEPFTVWEADEGVNMVASPSLASECGEIMRRVAATEGAGGVFHCCASGSTSRMELATLACEVFGLDQSLVRSGPPDPESAPGVPIPYDTSLSVVRTREVLDYEPLTVRELLERFRAERDTGALVTSSS